MENELKGLSNQTLFNDYTKQIFLICKEKRNQQQVKMGSAFASGIDCFGFGVMVGKRIERSKHKISNNKVIERQKELLLEIDNLVMKKNRLEKLVADIKVVASETIEALTEKEIPINNKEVLVCIKKAYTKV